MKKNLALLTALGVLSSTAHALPTIYPDTKTFDFLSEIDNKTNSNLVADNVNPFTVYVMPPKTATSTVGELHTKTTNLGFCGEMADLQSFSRSTVQRIEKLQIEEVEAKSEADAIRKKLADARQDMANYVVAKKLDELDQTSERIAFIEIRLTELANQYANCNDLCQDIKEEMKDLRDEKMKLTILRQKLAAKQTKEAKEYERKKDIVAGYKESLEVMDKSWIDLSNRLNDMRNRYHEMYNQFAKMEGARAPIKFESGWDQNVQQLRDNNPGFDFKKIMTKDAVIYTNILNTQNLPSNGAILSYELPAKMEDGKITLPEFPENLSGNVRLSLIGACVALSPEKFIEAKEFATFDSKAMKYGMTVTYEYPSAFVAKVTVKYNMYKMYQKIVSSSSSGGWFSSSSSSSVIEKNFFKDSFAVDWTEQDLITKLDDQRKSEIEAELLKNVLNRLATLALPITPNGQALLAANPPPKTGAMVASDSLKKACPTNVYCIAGAMALDFLQATFGSSSSKSSYTNIQDIEVQDKWSTTKTSFLPWITTYN